LIHVDDVARACLVVIKSGGNGIKTYNVSSGPYTMREIVEAIAQGLGQPASRMSVPSWLVLQPLKASAKIVRRFEPFKTVVEKWLSDDIFDGSRFARDYKFHPVVNLKEGLKREADWFRSVAEQ
jgi:nucleoside-diphosphate-sugar epimerase